MSDDVDKAAEKVETTQADAVAAKDELRKAGEAAKAEGEAKQAEGEAAVEKADE